MKVVILCGGQGTRIRDVNELLPKPMLSIGNRPILWHIMKIYAHYGCKDFVLCLGYKGWLIKEFFLNYHAQTSTVSLCLGNPHSVTYKVMHDERDWKVTLVDTGENSQTAQRLWQIQNEIKDEQWVHVTYGDGVADIDLNALQKVHEKNGLLATISGVHPSGRFGEIELDGNVIKEFNEKPNVNAGLINGGFMILNKKVITKYIDGKLNQSLESDILPKLVHEKQVGVYKHPGAWQCVDTPREYALLNQLWSDHKAFWKVYDKKK